MGKLAVCSACGGFKKDAVCPHCGRRGPTRRLVRALGGAIGGGAIAMTLMACYGVAPCPDGTTDCHKSPPAPAPVGDDAGTSTPIAK